MTPTPLRSGAIKAKRLKEHKNSIDKLLEKFSTTKKDDDLYQLRTTVSNEIRGLVSEIRVFTDMHINPWEISDDSIEDVVELENYEELHEYEERGELADLGTFKRREVLTDGLLSSAFRRVLAEKGYKTNEQIAEKNPSFRVLRVSYT